MLIPYLFTWAVLGAAPTATATSTVSDPGPRLLRLELRVSSGPEVDTNARRAVPGADPGPFTNPSRAADVVTDGLVRLMLESDASVRFHPAHALRVRYVLGAKRFFQEDTEDLLAHDLSVSTQHTLLARLAGALFGSYRGSRIRNGLRDYDLASAGANLTFLPHQIVELQLGADFTRFTFEPEPRFDYLAPRLSLGATVRPFSRVYLSARADHMWRYYQGNALVLATRLGNDGEPVVPLQQTVNFCESADTDRVECTPRVRRDRELILSGGVAYRGTWVGSVQYALRRQRSTSDFENIDRHRIVASATFGLPFDVTATLVGSLQLDNGVSVTDGQNLAEDDENRNSLQAQLRYRFTDAITVEARYALFANQFSTAAVSFLRQTGYLGLSFRTDLAAAPRPEAVSNP